MINFLLRKSAWGLEKCEDSITSIVFEPCPYFHPISYGRFYVVLRRLRKNFLGNCYI